MRVLIAALIFVSVLAAQRGGQGGFRGGGGHGFRGGHGFVRGGFVHGRGFSGGFVRGHHRGFVGGGFRFGRGFYGGFRRGWYPRHFGRGWYGGGFIGFGGWYGAPLWNSPVYYSSPGYAYPSVNIVTVPVDPAPSQPTIIINENGRPSSRYELDRSEVRRPDVSRSPVYLIATTDSVVWAALAYWIEDDVLHFVTSKNERKQIPLSQIDRPLTEQLNRERNIELRLP